MENSIYFDNAATSFPKAPGLGKAVGEFIEKDLVNVNRGVYKLSHKTEEMVLSTRIKIAKFFGCENDDDFVRNVIFTSGITMSLNMFLRGTLNTNDHIICSPFEHHAVLRTLYELKDTKKISFSIAKADEKGYVDIDSIEELINDKTKAIIINHGSNVFGTINDIEKIGKIAKEHDLFFAVDTAQTAGKINISMKDCNIDFLAFSGHKGLMALEGIGGFIISDRLSKVMRPLITGGTGSESDKCVQPDYLPDKYESGTLNLPGIFSLSYSIDYINKETIEKIRTYEMSLRRKFIENLNCRDDIIIYCKENKEKYMLPIVSLSFINKDNGEITRVLEEDYGIMLREGFHCSMLSHVTMKTENTGTIRFSFGYFNKVEEVEITTNIISNIEL